MALTGRTNTTMKPKAISQLYRMYGPVDAIEMAPEKSIPVVSDRGEAAFATHSAFTPADAFK